MTHQQHLSLCLLPVEKDGLLAIELSYGGSSDIHCNDDDVE